MNKQMELWKWRVGRRERSARSGGVNGDGVDAGPRKDGGRSSGPCATETGSSMSCARAHKEREESGGQKGSPTGRLLGAQISRRCRPARYPHGLPAIPQHARLTSPRRRENARTRRPAAEPVAEGGHVRAPSANLAAADAVSPRGGARSHLLVF